MGAEEGEAKSLSSFGPDEIGGQSVRVAPEQQRGYRGTLSGTGVPVLSGLTPPNTCSTALTMATIDGLNRRFEQALQRHLTQQQELKTLAERVLAQIREHLRATPDQVVPRSNYESEEKAGIYHLPFAIILDDGKSIEGLIALQEFDTHYQLVVRTAGGQGSGKLAKRTRAANETLEQYQRLQTQDVIQKLDEGLERSVERRAIELKDGGTLAL